MKTFTSHWLLGCIWLAVALSLSPWTFGQGTAHPGKQAQPTVQGPLTTAQAQSLTLEVLARVQLIRALDLKGKLNISVKTKPELRKYLVERTKKEMPPELFLASQKALQKFGLIPKDMNLEKFVLDLLTEQIAGFYDEDAKKLFLMAETPMSLQKACLSHEITHALQDAHFNLKGMDLDRKDNDDYVLAAKSVAEGDALLVMIEYVAQVAASDPGILSDVQRLADGSGGMSSEVLDRAPNYIKSDLLFPYISGVSFVTTLRGRNGWAAVNEAYRHLPLSSEQILHPEKYLDKPDPPVLVSMPDMAKALGPHWKRLATNVMGEFSVRVLMKEFGLADKAAPVAEGWGGDEYGVYQWQPAKGQEGKQEKIAIAWFTTWDTVSDAKEFFDAYAALIRQKYPESRKKNEPDVPREGRTEPDKKQVNKEAAGPAPEHITWFTAQDDVYMERRDADVLVIEGCPDDHLDAVSTSAWKTKKKRADFTPPPIGKGAQAQPQPNPLDAFLKGLGSVPEGVGDLLAALTQGPRSKGEVIGRTYRDYTHHFEVSAPRTGWSIEQDTPIAMMPVMLMNPSSSASVNVAVFNMSLAPVESWAPMLEMMLPMQFQNFKKLGSGNITLNQQPAYEITYSGSKEGLEIRIRQVIIVAGGKTYIITCGAIAELYKDCEPDINKILQSFRITKPAPEKSEKKVPAPVGQK